MPLSFRRSTAPPTALPDGIVRSYIDSPRGQLELMSAVPKSFTNTTPLLFVHGGFGCAAVWLEYMSYLSAAPLNIPCYAISLRGHGASWKPGYLSMTFFTTKRMLADDITAGVRHVERLMLDQGLSDPRAILAAHSNGGGLAQVALDAGDFQVKGLILVDAAPPSGLLPVYWNWLKADPWFPLRVYPHLMHSRSPLSSTALVKNAFFSDNFPAEKVRDFESRMSPFESLTWPIGLMLRFARVTSILKHVSLALHRPSVLILAAEKSRLMGVPLMKRMADEYALGAAEVLTQQGKEAPAADLTAIVRLEVVTGAGHHVQNDIGWQDGAEKVGRFYQDATKA